MIVEHDDDMMLAEMVADLDSAARRADVVRQALLAAGLHECGE